MLKVLDVIIALDLEVVDRKLPELQESIIGFSIDTRTLKKGEVYIALKGESTDGHLFIKQAIEKGASAIILEDEDYVGDCLHMTYFLVPNTLKALEKIAMAYRVKVNPSSKTIALTGSVGKTTLKEFLNTIISPFLKTTCSQKSFNNHIGVPLTLCSLAEDTQCSIFEIGMNHKGEIKPLSYMVSPDVAIITAIEPAHIGHLGSLEAIAHEKADILEGILPGGTAILPIDSPFCDFLIEKALKRATKIITLGKKEGATIRLISTTYTEKGVKIWARIWGKEYTWEMPVFAEHYVMLSLFAVAIAVELNLDVYDLIPYLSNLKPLPGRGSIEKISLSNGRDITVIDDSYNANLSSMCAGLSVLNQLEGMRKIAVLGDMAELGDFKDSILKDLADHIKTLNIDAIFTVGESIHTIEKHIHQNCRFFHKNTVQEMTPDVLDFLKNQDMIFVKGSNVNKLSYLIEQLKAG
ncbi:MAG: UDP-N-acetylmuramoyl-tripeptide--D-alanyl-D-alanine ligase [Proteobacteria bacterium]|nr:UDP-N-acetylmuramoyl-tripeptide--D-alanyl-D-alanine ligase [Pseudomonadota bacterium]